MTRHGVRGFLVLALLVATASWIACGLTDKDPQASEIKLVINELVSNGANDEPDWIELKNTGTKDVDLTGFTLADSKDKWTFPAGTSIAKGEYLMVVADDPAEDPKDGALHTNFKLSSSGEVLKLMDADSKVVDEVTFGELAEGTSWGRVPDGTGEWQAISSPTPGEANKASTPDDAGPEKDVGMKPADTGPDTAIPDQMVTDSKVVLNELVAKALADGPDWVELYNLGDQEMDIGGFTLSDAADTWPFPAGTKIPAGGFIVVIADDLGTPPGDGKLHANFKLSSTNGESLTLKDAGGKVIDAITFGAQTMGVSWGRLPDGTGSWQALEPTEGAANKKAAPDDAGAQDGTTVKDAGID